MEGNGLFWFKTICFPPIISYFKVDAIRDSPFPLKCLARWSSFPRWGLAAGRGGSGGLRALGRAQVGCPRLRRVPPHLAVSPDSHTLGHTQPCTHPAPGDPRDPLLPTTHPAQLLLAPWSPQDTLDTMYTPSASTPVIWGVSSTLQPSTARPRLSLLESSQSWPPLGELLFPLHATHRPRGNGGQSRAPCCRNPTTTILTLL